jgi:carboxypeptidase T
MEEFMKKKMLLILMIVLCLTGLLSLNRVVVRFDNPNPQLFQRFLMEKADIAAYHPGQFLDLVVNREQAVLLQNEFPSLHIQQTEAQSQVNLHSQDRDIAGYRSYTTMVTELNQIVAAHPDICRLYNLGDTWGKQYYEGGNSNYEPYQFSIWAMKVSDNPDLEEDEPGVYYLGTHHAREPLGVETTMKVLHQLVDNYGTNTVMTERVNSTQTWFVPLVNPDGHEIVWGEIDTWWRKNIRDNNNNGVFDSWYQYGYGDDGVDLNRNYGVYWGALGATDDMPSAVYHGLNAFSEPETAIVKNLLDSHHFVAGISYHTYAGLVLYPTGYYVGADAPDIEALSSIADQMAATLTGYTAESESELYPAMGGTDDYSYAEHGTFAFTIELGLNEFIPPANEVNQIVNQNMNAAFLVMDRIKKASLVGIVTDSLTNLPLEATITIPGIDNRGAYRKPYKSDSMYGRYYRILNSGTYTTIYSAYGYKSVVSPNVIIAETSQTVQDIQMVPAPPASLIGRVTNGNTLQGIPGAVVKFPNTPLPDTFTDAEGYFNIPSTYAGTYTIDIYKDGYDWMQIPITLQEGVNHIEWQLQTPFMEDNFETNTNWITTGTWARTTVQHVSGTHCLTDSPGNYNGNMPSTSTAQYPVPINLVDTPNISVSFMVKVSMFPNYDYVNFECSKNGQNWQTIDAYYNTEGWTLKTYNLNQFLPGNLYMRFHMVTKGYGEGDGIYIDDFKIFMHSIVPAITTTQPPLKLSLYQNAPNPFNPETTISYTLPRRGSISLDIFNIKGQVVKSLVSERQEQGFYSISWDGKDNNGNSVASGVYFYRLEAEGQTSQTKKMILLK